MPGENRGPDEGAFLLEQRFRYTYASPARMLRHRLVVVPRSGHGGQRRLDHGLTVTGSSAGVSTTDDDFSNHVIEVRAAAVQEWIEFEAWALVERGGTPGVTVLPEPALTDRRLLEATRLTEAEGELGEAASRLRAAGLGPLDRAEEACTWAHRAITYAFGVTGVRTSAAAAVAGGRGVCQDHAHIMLALCRAAGVPARYVSGHLVGEGGSHAWVEVVVPSGSRGAVAVAFDPTHARRAGHSYLTVAVGRDYTDVAPTSGTFEGASPGILSATKRLTMVAAAELDVDTARR